MKTRTTRHFDRAFLKFPAQVRRLYNKQVSFLVIDIRHPSLRAKKYDETEGVWQMRVTNNIRAYFLIQGDVYIFLDIEKHRD